MADVYGVSLNVKVDDEIRKGLRDAMRRVRNPAPMYDEIGASLETSTKMRFEKKVDPDGTPWAKHSEVTLALLAAEKRKPNLLQRSRRLYGSIHYQVLGGGVGVEVGVVSEYGRIHQLGGQAGRNKKVTIPARPYLGVSEDDATEIEAIVVSHIEKKS